MRKTIDIDLTPEELAKPELLRLAVARRLGVGEDDLTHAEVLHRSLDSRRGRITFHAAVEAFIGEAYTAPIFHGDYQDCSGKPAVVIVGAGPAGLFAALRALELGLRPVIIERGRPVEARRRDIALMARTRHTNPESNWCFGEGGAGTFSDGKLYTRSTKRGNVQAVLERFVEHGASPSILIDAHAHIGTDRLGGIIAGIRRTIERHGGEYHFGSRVTDFVFASGSPAAVAGVRDSEGNEYLGKAVVLATGHSARDIYELFDRRGWTLEPKPFALGVRVEHPQCLIDSIQYHSRGNSRPPFLPAAAYSLSAQVDGHGVFSFCMCPGGVIVPAATAPGEQVVNGMSNSQRNSPFANSGIAVTVSPADVPHYGSQGPLGLLRFQQEVERRAASAAGGGLTAPAQRLSDFCSRRPSQSLNTTNYLGDIAAIPLHELLPPFVARCLQQGFFLFDKKMRGFLTDQATLLAVESRTSSPVRIPRGDNLQHPRLPRLFPCGEGAGYAGGIVSSALDGVRVMEAVYGL